VNDSKIDKSEYESVKSKLDTAVEALNKIVNEPMPTVSRLIIAREALRKISAK